MKIDATAHKEGVIFDDDSSCPRTMSRNSMFRSPRSEWLQYSKQGTLKGSSRRLVINTTSATVGTMRAILIFIVVASVAMKQGSADSCSYAPRPIGCSVGDGVPYKRTFTPACRKHDICYNCGAAYRVSRARCDDIFRSYMRRACNGRVSCLFWSDTYYTGVRALGDIFYHISPPFWCNQGWVRRCIF